MPEERLTLSVEETARVLGISRGSCYEAVKQGQIPHIRFGKRILIPRKALLKMLSDDSNMDYIQ